MEKFNGKRSSSSHGRLIRLNCLLAICFALWLYLLFFNVSNPAGIAPPPPIASPTDWCSGRYVYVQSLPSKFNSDLITACHNLSKWTDMCRYVANAGLGPLIEDSDGVFAETGWYATNQFALELIFHNRMKQYDCITSDSALASTIYVPFYAGLDIGRYLWGYNTSVRDSAAADLIRWLTSRPEWARMGGRDHFLVAGRITWDFRRLSEGGVWGNNFLFMPEAKNMSVLVIESSPWHGNDFGVPYPTYFHPSTEAEIVSWQERMSRLERPWLFSFAGAPRPNMTESIRGRLIKQCQSSGRCKLLECHMGASKCHSPSSVMKMFQSSVFCLQPQGDSYTRRSAFDAMLAGCIPVFFHPGSAYVQYQWHLPRNYTAYSVFIPEDEVRDGKVSVEEVLMGFGEEEVRRMREVVVDMIPRLVYRDPRSKMEGIKDAFDVAVKGVIKRVEELRRDLRAGVEEEHNSWRSGLVVRGKEHEWDHFFSRQRR